jgi:putative cell wall-binding protein
VIQAELARLRPGRIVVLGGENIVQPAVADQLATLATGGLTRLAGADRFDTSAAISAATFSPGVPVVYLANGYAFPDALSGAPVAARNGAPVLLVQAGGIPAVIQTELNRLRPGRIVVLGGENSVNSAILP